MKEWLMENMEHPFPNDEVIQKFETEYRIRKDVIITWFENARVVMDPAKYVPSQMNEKSDNLKRVKLILLLIFSLK